MMKKLSRSLAAGLSILLILSACGLIDGKEGGGVVATLAPSLAPAQPTEAPAQPTQAPTSVSASGEPVGQAAVGARSEDPLGDWLDLRSVRTDPYALYNSPFQSFRLRAQWVVEAKEGAGVPAAVVQLEMARISDPLAEEMTFFDSRQDVSSSMVHVGNRLWSESGGQWIEVSTEDMSSFDQMLSALGSATPHLRGDAQLVGDENVNGVDTRHYTFDETNLGPDAGDYSRITGDVWVAVDGYYPIKFLFAAEDENATYRWDWEVYDINAPLSIEPPVGVQGG